MTLAFANGTRHLLFAALSVCLGLLLVGCFDGLSSDESGSKSFDTEYFDQGQAHLSDGQLTLAKSEFSNSISYERLNEAESYVGLAIVELLLLPQSEGATGLFLTLGADPSQVPVDVERDLYGTDGLLDRLHSGATEQLIEEAFYQTLPWPRAVIEAGPAQLFAGIDSAATFNTLRPHLIALDDDLDNISALLEVGLDREFVQYTLPAGTLYSPRPHVFRRSEIKALLGTIYAARALIHAALAYDWAIPLGPVMVSMDAESMDLQTVVDLLNSGTMMALWGGGINDPAGQEHLDRARAHATRSLDLFMASVNDGVEDERSGRSGTLDWSEMTSTEIDQLLTFGNELRDFVANDVPVSFSLSDPAVSGTAAPFFNGQLARTDASPDIWVLLFDDLMQRDVVAISDEAVEALWIDPLFTPTFTLDDPPDLTGHASFGGIMSAGALDRISSEIQNDYNF